MAKLRDYVLRRLLLLIPVLVGVSLITFTLSHVVPGDPARAYCGQRCPQSSVERIRERYHFDEPLWVQFQFYLQNLVKGDLGFSLVDNRPVSESLLQYFPATFELTLVAMFIAAIGGVVTGVVSATRQDQPIDHITRFIAITGVSMPIFWLALMLQFFLGFKADLFPISGRIDPFIPKPPKLTGMLLFDSLVAGNWEALGNAAWHIVLPAVTLAYASLGIVLRMTRSSMLEVMNEDYIRTARAKGLDDRVVTYKHALRNALIPTVTILGLQFGGLLGGAVLTETIFGWPGMGRYAVRAVFGLDYAAIMGFTFVVAIIYVLANLIVDVLYAFLDPRIRLG